MVLLAAAHPIVHVNAALNTLAAILLVVAYIFIRKGWENAHKNTMIAAMIVSILFLGCYIYYHFLGDEVHFTYPAVAVRVTYFGILLSHILLAITVPFIAVYLTTLGLKIFQLDESERGTEIEQKFREKHRKVARWGLPIWLYVSVTGVIVYLMLYHLWPPETL